MQGLRKKEFVHPLVNREGRSPESQRLRFMVVVTILVPNQLPVLGRQQKLSPELLGCPRVSTINLIQTTSLGFPHSSVGKEYTCNAGDPSSIPGSGRSPGEGKGYPLQYSGMENYMNCIVHGVTKSWARLSDFHFTSEYSYFSLLSTHLLLCQYHGGLIIVSLQ